MNHELIIQAEAVWEIHDAYHWYEGQKPGLGEELLKVLDELFLLIDQHPRIFVEKYKNQRQAVLKKFPYVVMYQAKGGQLIVYAVFHTSRDPRKKLRK